MHYTDHRGQRSDDEGDEEEEGEVEEVEEAEASVKKGSEEEDSDREAEQKEKKADSTQVVFSPTAAAQIGFISSDDHVCQVDDLSAAERQSLLRNELRPAIKPFKGNKLFLRFATQGLSFI